MNKTCRAQVDAVSSQVSFTAPIRKPFAVPFFLSLSLLITLLSGVASKKLFAGQVTGNGGPSCGNGGIRRVQFQCHALDKNAYYSAVEIWSKDCDNFVVVQLHMRSSSESTLSLGRIFYQYRNEICSPTNPQNCSGELVFNVYTVRLDAGREIEIKFPPHSFNGIAQLNFGSSEPNTMRCELL